MSSCFRMLQKKSDSESYGEIQADLTIDIGYIAPTTFDTRNSLVGALTKEFASDRLNRVFLIYVVQGITPWSPTTTNIADQDHSFTGGLLINRTSFDDFLRGDSPFASWVMSAFTLFRKTRSLPSTTSNRLHHSQRLQVLVGILQIRPYTTIRSSER